MNKLSVQNIDLLGARIIDPVENIDEVRDLFIRDGTLLHCDDGIKKAEKKYQLKDHTILPGLLDLRTHNRVPGAVKSENMKSLTRAAARGGFSSILTMPNTNPASDNPATIRYIQDRIKQYSSIKVFLSGCLTLQSKGISIAPLGSLKEVGVIAVSDCPRTPSNNQIFLNALKYAKMFDLTVIDFPQDSYLSTDTDVHESALSLKLGLRGNPRLAEELAVQRSILISSHLDIPIHLSSLSSKGSVSLVKKAKEDGIKITSDVSAHHLLFTQEKISSYQNCSKLYPPLREEIDRDALLEGLKNGYIDACNSSHDPYADHLHDIEFDLAPMGAIGLETAVSCFIEALRLKDPYPELALKMSSNPHRILGLKLPSLKPFGEADLVIIKNHEPWTYDCFNGESLSHNSPLHGHLFSSKVVMTVSSGKIAYTNI